MGNNDSSLLSETTIDENPIVSTGDWFLHHAQRNADNTPLSVFIGKEDSVSATEVTALESMARNLRLFRHPHILKYVQSCRCATTGAHYLFTEKTSPLSIVLKHHSALQRCLGLRDVGEALLFLHERVTACHNNLEMSSVLVTPEGRWKLGGLQFLKKFEEINQQFLDQTRPKRPSAAEELETGLPINHRAISRDIFSFGVFIEQVLGGLSEGDLAGSEDFLSFVKSSIMSKDPAKRPKLQSILGHSIFSQDYLHTVHFLTDLPLKPEAERERFFSGLTEKLLGLPEETVALQLTPLLLSRYVLLDKTAREKFMVNLLTPSEGIDKRDFDANADVNPILSEQLFKEHVIPILIKIFYVRDLQIRLVLLRHFPSFCNMFPKVVLEDDILPQLLLGVKDSDDGMVAATLKALAELVPILGASTVVGKTRRKVFSDGAPIEASKSLRLSSPQRLIVGKRMGLEKKNLEREVSFSPDPPFRLEPSSHRRSPIGAETSEDDVDDVEVKSWEGKDKASQDRGQEAAWDAWDVEEEAEEVETAPTPNVAATAVGRRKKSSESSALDFFVDMEPRIRPMEPLLAVAPVVALSKFAALADDNVDEVGWDNDDPIEFE